MRIVHRFPLSAAQLARCRRVILAATLLALGAPAHATDFTWTGGDTTNFWQAPDNWNPSGIPGASSNVTFPTLGSFVTVTNNNFTISANTITFNTTDTVSINLLFQTFQRTILLSGNTITRTSTSAGTQSISGKVQISGNATWPINGAGLLSLATVEEATPGLSFTKTGTGTLSIGSASYTGATTVNGGMLIAGGFASAAPAVTVNSGASISPVELLTVSHPLVLNGIGAGGNGALRGIEISGWGGGITLNTDSAIGVDAGGFLNITGVITDGALTRSLTKIGPGTLLLHTANTYNGSTNVNGGTLELDDVAAAGATNITVNAGGTAAPGDGLSINNSLFLNGSGTGGGGALRSPLGGTGTWSGSVIMQSNSSLGAGDGEELVITGLLGGASSSATKVGPGTVTLANSSTYNGSTIVAEGILKLRNPNALPTLTTGTTVSAGATLAIQDTLAHVPVNMNKPVSLNGAGIDGDGALRNISSSNIWSGAITLQSNSTVGIDSAGDQFVISGAIGGAFNLTKVGPGTLFLSNTGNSYNNTIINEGLLNLAVPNALPAAGTLIINSGGTAQIQGNVTVNRALSITASGVGGVGALDSVSGANTWSGTVNTTGASSVIGVDAGELRITGALGGTGQLLKKGAGKLTLAGANTFVSADIQAGILGLESSGALPSGSDLTTHPDTAIEIKGGVALAGAALLSGGGVGNSGALRNITNNNTWAGAITIGSADANIGADAASQLTISGSITDGAQAYPLTKVGAGTLVLSSANTYDGGTFINGGTLSISADNNLGNPARTVTTNNGGKLLVSGNMTSARTFNLNTGSLQVGSGATLTYTNATVNGGFLRGPGTHAIGVNSSFSGVTALNGTNITQSQPTTLANFTNAGNLTSSAALTWDGGFNSSSGIITVSNLFNTQGFENDGVINVNSGGAITNTTSPLVSGGGARITINLGGTINVGPSFELNGSLLVNNGTVSGQTNVNYGALAKGSGNYGAVNVTDGGKFSPGNSPGSVTTGPTTWNSGGNYLVEMADALAGAGIGWDMWLIDGQLDLNATSSTNGRFTIALASMDDLVFDYTRDYTWPILHASGGISGFDPSELKLDTFGFKSEVGSGRFSLQSTPSELSIHFSSVPEPGAAALLLVALSVIGRRRSERTK